LHSRWVRFSGAYPCTYSGRCYSSITRFVWDGEQILWEVRQADGSNKDVKDPSGGAQTGNIGYVHAGGIDAPLGMVRNGSTVALHRNWRGLYAFATDENGDPFTCAPQSFSGCDDVSWPGGTWNLQRGPIDPHATQTWYGSVSMGQQDRTGLLYQRNRYYDSSTGQFTRQDPIGIAGGLNLYGYANGDPVNFHDPFGLVCEEVDEPIDTHPTTKECDESVAFVGIQATGIIGAGGSLSLGVIWDSEQGLSGLGVYGSGSVNVGLDVSVGGEGGLSERRGAFNGTAVEECGAFYAGGCVSGNENGMTYSGTLGVGTSSNLPSRYLASSAGVRATGSLTFGDVVNKAAKYAAQAERWIKYTITRGVLSGYR